MPVLDFMYDPKNRTLIIAAGLIVVLLIVLLITLAVTKPKDSDVDMEAEKIEQRSEPEFSALFQGASPRNKLIIPDVRREGLELTWIRYREENHLWTDEEIGRYWIPPEDISREWLEEYNRREVDALFKEIP